jgi:hypothetical protein
MLGFVSRNPSKKELPRSALGTEIFSGRTFSSIGPVLIFGPARSIKIIHLRLCPFSRRTNRFSASRIALIINLHSRSVLCAQLIRAMSQAAAQLIHVDRYQKNQVLP